MNRKQLNLSVSESERTCESLSAGVDPSQPLRRAEIWYFQDTAVGVDENVITLQIEKRKTSMRTHTPILLAEIPLRCWDNVLESDKQQVTTCCIWGGGRHPSQNKVISVYRPLMMLIWPCCWIGGTHGEEAAGLNDCLWWECYQCWFVIAETNREGVLHEKREVGITVVAEEL